VAETTIQVFPVGGFVRITIAHLMAVFVMPEMIRRGSGLVLAIGDHRRPAELYRQEDQAKNDQQASQGV